MATHIRTKSTVSTLTALALGLSVIGLSGCGATTGGVQNALAQKMASEAVQKAMENDETAVVTTVTTETVAVTPVDVTEDMSPDCEKVAMKMVKVDTRIAAANEVIATGNSSVVAGQAAAAATSSGAAHMGAAQAISKVPFGGLFAKKALDGMANSGKKKIAKAEKDLQKATLERAKLEGRYAGMNCAGTES